MAARVLVVGAGPVGAIIAALLARRGSGCAVRLWDKARGPGGRMSTSRSPNNESCSADLGAQYISATPAYWLEHEKFYEELLDRGILYPLQSQVDGMKEYEENIRHFIVPEGTSSLVKYYLQESGAEVLYNHHVQRVHLGDGVVTVENQDGSSACVDTLILTMPIPQILQLQGNLQAMLNADQRRALEMATYSSRFALGLFYNSDADFEFPWTAKYVSDNSVIRYIAVNKKKRSQECGSVGPSLVVHTNVAFGQKYVDEDVNVVQPFILAELNRLLPGLPQHAYGKCHKWRYSQVTRPVGGSAGHMVLSAEPLILCAGDGFTHSNFDGCVKSALSAVEAFKSIFLDGKSGH
ncbi:renalase isoform X1 [Lampetra fluviatilis]